MSGRTEGKDRGFIQLGFLAPREWGEVARRSRDGEGPRPTKAPSPAGEPVLGLAEGKTRGRPPLPRFAVGEEPKS